VEHLQHFGLKQDPFQNDPDLRFYFDSASHAEPQRRVERGLRQNKGLSVMTGDAGTGKTLLTRRILEGLEEELFDAHLMMMLPGVTDAGSILSRYARMLGVEDCSGDRPTLLAEVYEKLAISREEGRHAVLMLDDAHLIGRESLAEIGGLLNLEYEDRRLISLLLVGLPALDVTLSHEASLGQRVDIRTRIEPLDLRSTTAYLLHRMARAGGEQSTIAEEAIACLYKFGRGRPRLLNTLADNALFEAYLNGQNQVCAGDIERAAADLGIGSDPGSTYTPHSGPSADNFGIQSSSFDTGLEPDSISNLAETPDARGSAGLDISGLIAPPTSSDDEKTSLISMAELPIGGSDELDAAVSAVLDDPESVSTIGAELDFELGGGSGGELPSFQGTNDPAFENPEATRIAMPGEEAQAATGSGGDSDDFDDLFVELIDD